MYILQVDSSQTHALLLEGLEYELYKSPLAFLKADLKLAGYAHYRQKETVARHGPYNEIQIILEGQTEVRLDKVTLPLCEAPAVQIFSLGEEAEITNYPGLKKIFFHFDLTFGKAEFLLGTSQLRRILPNSDFLWWEKIKQVVESKNSLGAQALLFEALSFFQEDFLKIATGKNHYLSRFQLFFEFVKKTPVNQFSMKNAAALYQLNPNHFSNQFKRHTGQAAKHFFLSEKIRQAKASLIQTDHNLASIAEALGFFDGFHLSRTFQKYVGMAPREFRKKYPQAVQPSKTYLQNPE